MFGLGQFCTAVQWVELTVAGGSSAGSASKCLWLLVQTPIMLFSLCAFNGGSLLLFSCLMLGFSLPTKWRPILLSLGLSSDEWWPEDWSQPTCRQRERRMSKVPPAQFELDEPAGPGSRAYGTGLNQQSFSIFVFECVLAVFHFTLSLSTIENHSPPPGLVTYHNTKQLSLSGDGTQWLLTPAYTLYFARNFLLKMPPSSLLCHQNLYVCLLALLNWSPQETFKSVYPTGWLLYSKFQWY